MSVFGLRKRSRYRALLPALERMFAKLTPKKFSGILAQHCVQVFSKKKICILVHDDATRGWAELSERLFSSGQWSHMERPVMSKVLAALPLPI